MNRDEIREAVLSCLCEVAPEVDPTQVKHDVSFRDQLDVDSMDLLNFVIAMHERLHVDIPESEYGRLGTVDLLVEYIAGQLAAADAAVGTQGR
jgi:acyl carrier protein